MPPLGSHADHEEELAGAQLEPPATEPVTTAMETVPGHLDAGKNACFIRGTKPNPRVKPINMNYTS